MAAPALAPTKRWAWTPLCTTQSKTQHQHTVPRKARRARSWPAPAARLLAEHCIFVFVALHNVVSTHSCTKPNAAGKIPPGCQGVGFWYSTTAEGQCTADARPGDGSGCTWRSWSVKSVNATCMRDHVLAFVGSSNPTCFAECPGARTHTRVDAVCVMTSAYRPRRFARVFCWIFSARVWCSQVVAQISAAHARVVATSRRCMAGARDKNLITAGAATAIILELHPSESSVCSICRLTGARCAIDF